MIEERSAQIGRWRAEQGRKQRAQCRHNSSSIPSSPSVLSSTHNMYKATKKVSSLNWAILMMPLTAEKAIKQARPMLMNLDKGITYFAQAGLGGGSERRGRVGG